MATPALGIDELIGFYSQLIRIRSFEEQVQRLSAAGEVPGFPHLCIGQEAVAVGVCSQLRAGDVMFSGHRAHGHTLAMGSDPFATFAEILGRQDGLCKGRGGSMHLVDASRGMLGATGVVGGNLPLAAGAAWAAQVRGAGDVALVFFGDGATGSGVFHETLNLAALWSLPLLMVCENNGLAEFTTREEHSTVGQVSAFAAPYEMAAETIDGNDVLAVHAAAGSALARMRSQGKPYLLECMTHRMAGHYVGDPQAYRDKEEVARSRQLDPIDRLRRHLVERGVDDARLAEAEGSARSDIATAVERARLAAQPDPAEVMSFVLASDIDQRAGAAT